jgi:hypothetical protein
MPRVKAGGSFGSAKASVPQCFHRSLPQDGSKNGSRLFAHHFSSAESLDPAAVSYSPNSACDPSLTSCNVSESGLR